MTFRHNQTGSHVIALAVSVLVIGVIVFAGYTVWQNQDATEEAATQQSAAASSVPVTEQQVSEDSATLDSASDELDSGLDDTALDADLNDLL